MHSGKCFVVVRLVILMAVGTRAVQQASESENPETTTLSTTISPHPSSLAQVPVKNETAQREQLDKFAKRMKDAIKSAKQMTQPDGLLERTVRTNFLHTLFLMANASAIAGTTVSRAAGTLIRGFVQDSFNLVSIGFYLPRLIFLDGPTQFIELLRLVRSNQVRIPRDIDEAIDTVINFASVVRESQVTGNLATPFLKFFPNVFRGAELLSTEVLFNVFAWLAPLSPTDVSAASLEGLWNRWDVKSSTTARYNADKRFQTLPPTTS